MPPDQQRQSTATEGTNLEKVIQQNVEKSNDMLDYNYERILVYATGWGVFRLQWLQ